MMWHYAHIHTVNKRGVDAELNRIGHYLKAAGLPLLERVKTAGSKELVQVDWRQEKSLPSGFKKQRDRRLGLREKTYRAITELADTRVHQISKAMLDSSDSRTSPCRRGRSARGRQPACQHFEVTRQ